MKKTIRKVLLLLSLLTLSFTLIVHAEQTIHSIVEKTDYTISSSKGDTIKIKATATTEGIKESDITNLFVEAAVTKPSGDLLASNNATVHQKTTVSANTSYNCPPTQKNFSVVGWSKARIRLSDDFTGEYLSHLSTIDMNTWEISRSLDKDFSNSLNEQNNY